MPLTADDCKQLKTKAGYKLDLEIKPGMPLGQFQEELVIKTDHPKRGEVKVSISGNVNGSITVVPERLRMPNVLASSWRFPETSCSWFAAVSQPSSRLCASQHTRGGDRAQYRYTLDERTIPRDRQSAAWYRPRLDKRYNHP